MKYPLVLVAAVCLSACGTPPAKEIITVEVPVMPLPEKSLLSQFPTLPQLPPTDDDEVGASVLLKSTDAALRMCLGTSDKLVKWIYKTHDDIAAQKPIQK